MMKKSIYLLLAVVVLRHVLALSQAFVDIPYRDSWQIIENNLSLNFPISWFFRPHNEHIIFFTKFQVWLLYKINSWNVVVHLWLNLLIYFAAIFALYQLLKIDRTLFVLSFVFSFCSSNWENHSWEFQSCIHFFILFLILTASSLSKKRFHLALAYNFFMLISFSAAVGASLAFSLFSFLRKDVPKKVAFLFLLPNVLFFLHPGKSNVVLPYKFRFWDFLFNQISFGFGIERYSWFLGLVCFLLVFIPLVFNFDRKNLSLAQILSLACIASLAVVAVGRAGRENIQISSKGARYFEISNILVPCAFVMWSDFLSKFFSEKRVQLCLILFLVVPFVSTLDNWDYSLYKWIGEQKIIGRKCMREYQGGEIFCKTLWIGESSRQLELAKSLDLSFIKEP